MPTEHCPQVTPRPSAVVSVAEAAQGRAAGRAARLRIRRGEWTGHTSGLADHVVQGNLVVQSALVQGASAPPPPPASPPEKGELMVRDPVCGTFVLKAMPLSPSPEMVCCCT